MALTRSDKFIIAGAITLALVVVLGLAVWKKPQLFTGEAPKTETAQKTAPMPEQAATEQAAPDIPEPPAQTPAAETSSVAAPIAQAPAVEAQQSEAAAEETQPKEDQILFKGDETLDKMFADMHKAEDAAPAGETPMPRDKPAKTDEAAMPGAAPGATAETATESAPVSGPPAPSGKEETAASETSQAEMPADKADAKTSDNAELSPAFPPVEEKSETPAIKADAMDEPKIAPKTKTKTAPAKKTVKTAQAAPARGAVLGVTAEDRPGEFLLTVKTSAAPVGYEKFFLDGPPRVVLDLSGVWRYSGPWSLSGKGSLVRMIRLGKHADKFRVVIDLAQDADLILRGAPEISRIPGGLILKLQK